MVDVHKEGHVAFFYRSLKVVTKICATTAWTHVFLKGQTPLICVHPREEKGNILGASKVGTAFKAPPTKEESGFTSCFLAGPTREVRAKEKQGRESLLSIEAYTGGLFLSLDEYSFCHKTLIYFTKNRGFIYQCGRYEYIYFLCYVCN